MNKSAFLQLIQQAGNISDQQTEELEKVAATFPYCQTAHLLLAKSAYDKGSMLSTQRLRRASAYATNRQLLKRIIYTSPVAEPVFDEAAVEEQPVVPVEETTTPALLAVAPEAETLNPTLEEEIILAGTEQEEVAEEVITEPGSESSIHEEQVPLFAEAQLEDAAPFAAAEEVEEEATAPESIKLLPEKSILEQPMEKLDSELALLLTIKSLSPSFTDLLAQKPDVEPAPPFVTSPALQELDEPATEPEPEVAGEVHPPKEALASIIAAEAASAASAYYTLPEASEPAPVEEETEAAPEEAAITYAFDEIDQMYQQDVLGYWMSSSRMGESLQLKEENAFVRERPAAFHPELILEYSKAHGLQELEETPAPALSGQQDIIDQFLKISPRLKTLSNIKLKPEPQEDLSLNSTKIRRGTASESLASIFLKQGKVKKAIKIYEQLIWKYPEKKSYFAEQIEKLQNIS